MIGIWRGDQGIPVEHRVGACDHTQDLRFALRYDRPAKSRIVEDRITRRAVATMRTKSSESIRGRFASGVPLTGTSALIGTLSGCGDIAAKTCSIAARSRTGLTHADDAAAA
jgi:hypothetical protein